MSFGNLAVALAAVGSMASAVAAPVTFSGFAHGSQSVRGELSAPNQARDLTVRAGGFQTLYDGRSFVSYCVDFYQWLPSFGTPNSSYVPANAASFLGNRLDAVARLFSGRSAEVDTALEEAAFQIALWEIFYETTVAYDTNSGAAKFSDTNGADGDARALAQTYLNGLPGYARTMTVHVLKSDANQDVVWANRVPEPGTVALLMAGLVGLGAARRRQVARD